MEARSWRSFFLSSRRQRGRSSSRPRIVMRQRTCFMRSTTTIGLLTDSKRSRLEKQTFRTIPTRQTRMSIGSCTRPKMANHSTFARGGGGGHMELQAKEREEFAVGGRVLGGGKTRERGSRGI